MQSANSSDKSYSHEDYEPENDQDPEVASTHEKDAYDEILSSVGSRPSGSHEPAEEQEELGDDDIGIGERDIEKTLQKITKKGSIKSLKQKDPNIVSWDGPVSRNLAGFGYLMPRKNYIPSLKLESVIGRCSGQSPNP